jgi:hypothetical protein
MRKKVEKIFIATDIARTATLTGFPTSASNNLAAGEILVLDKDKNIITTGDTIDDTDTIFIAEGLSSTYSYVTPNGTSVTGVRQVKYSDPIQGIGVSEYSGKSYTAAAEQVTTVSFGTLTPVVGEEYVIRIVYKDLACEHPGQFTKTYRVVATSATLALLYDAFVAQINGTKERRVDATDNTTYITLTGKAYDDNDSLNSINEYAQVSFDVFLFSDNFASDAAVATTTVPTSGTGTWQLVRDEEKWSQGYEGLLNRTDFPLQVPDFRTVKSETYDVIVIRHKNWFTAVEGNEEQVDITTKIYLPDGASQTANVLADLNPWMASLPKAFPNVTF